MDKTIGKAVQKLTKAGEKAAPIKSLKLKVKFQKKRAAKKRGNPNSPANYGKAMNSAYKNTKVFGADPMAAKFGPKVQSSALGTKKPSTQKAMNMLGRGMKGYRK